METTYIPVHKSMTGTETARAVLSCSTLHFVYIMTHQVITHSVHTLYILIMLTLQLSKRLGMG